MNHLKVKASHGYSNDVNRDLHKALCLWHPKFGFKINFTAFDAIGQYTE